MNCCSKNQTKIKFDVQFILSAFYYCWLLTVYTFIKLQKFIIVYVFYIYQSPYFRSSKYIIISFFFLFLDPHVSNLAKALSAVILEFLVLIFYFLQHHPAHHVLRTMNHGSNIETYVHCTYMAGVQKNQGSLEYSWQMDLKI